MSSSQQNTETNYGQYSASKAHIEDHIPHFANLSSKREGRNKSKLQASNLALLKNNGNISEKVLHENEISIKDKVYNNIQDSRGYNTCAVYRGKQIEFLCSMNWKRLASEEIQELKQELTQERLLTTFSSQATSSQSRLPKRQKHLNIAKDLIYLDDLKESVGTTIENAAKATVVTDRKTCYFKTLGMNQIIDISDISRNSHLDLFSPLQQQQLIQKLNLPKIQTFFTYDVTAFENIIEKFRTIQDDKRFLSKSINEINDIKTGDTQAKKIYLQILETMLHDDYLYDPDEENSENDYIVKLHGPIMESEFRGTSIRLRWGDTSPKECKGNGFNCKIDLRVTTNAAKYMDLGTTEYAKKPGTSKYYKDKLKLVLSSFIHLRKYVSSNNTAAELKSVPLMLVEGLEGEAFLLSIVDEDWLAIRHISSIDVPNNVESIKNGDIKLYINGLNLFKGYCLNLKNQIYTTKKMKNITQPKQQPNNILKKPVWKSEYADESSDNE